MMMGAHKAIKSCSNSQNYKSPNNLMMRSICFVIMQAAQQFEQKKKIKFQMYCNGFVPIWI